MYPGERVRISLNFSDGTPPVIAEGIVTEIVEAARGKRNGVGVELSEILEGDDRFSRHVRRSGAGPTARRPRPA